MDSEVDDQKSNRKKNNKIEHESQLNTTDKTEQIE